MVVNNSTASQWHEPAGSLSREGFRSHERGLTPLHGDVDRLIHRERGVPMRIWGLSPRELHDAYWRSRGVQCLERGRAHTLQLAAELYLLLEPRQLAVFDIARLSERLAWRDAAVTRIRLVHRHESAYSEHVITDRNGLVQRIARRYRPLIGPEVFKPIAVTSNRRLAAIWMASTTRRQALCQLRRAVTWPRVDRCRCGGMLYREGDPDQERQMLLDLVQHWPCPGQVIEGLTESSPGVWHARDEELCSDAVRVGPIWLGRGNANASARIVIGPAFVVDSPQANNNAQQLVAMREIEDIESPPPRKARNRSGWRRRRWRRKNSSASSGNAFEPAAAFVKRTVDIVCSTMALCVASPIMVIVAACILLEDGWPLFFGHVRQGRGGRVFRCWKFRTMRRDAHKLVRHLSAENICDGPQVYIKNDPRVTRVGKIIRAANLDELPQFWNVLLGQMSLVGPRPSPDDENQYCPAWRDLRLSVRPGITGLWQLNRTRQRGADFQEWIKYDVQYVQHASLWLDMKIIVRTAVMVSGIGKTWQRVATWRGRRAKQHDLILLNGTSTDGPASTK